MNKNLIIGVLILVVVVLGGLLFKANFSSQTASIIRADDKYSAMTEEEALSQMEKSGTLYKWSDEEIKVIREAFSSVTPAPSAGERPYVCHTSTGSYPFNSLIDHGNYWPVTGSIWCGATAFSWY